MFRIAASLLLLGILAGCTQQAAPDSPEQTGSNTLKPVEGQLKVALLTPGPITDKGWSELAYKGLKAVESQLGAEIQNTETKDGTITDAMRSYASKGFNLIIGHGYEYNEVGVKLSKDFPNTVFVSSSGGATSTNAGAFRFYLEQGFYLAGAMAGTMSKTGKVAMIGGPNVPSIESTFKAFEAGAKAARPDIVVMKTYTGDGADAVKAKQATEKAIEQGADFVIHQANAAAKGVFEACKERNVYCFGSNADQNHEGPTVIASATIVAEPAYVDLAKAVKEGNYKGEITLKGMEEGAIDFVLNPALKSKIPADVIAKIESLKEEIKSGKLVVPKDNF